FSRAFAWCAETSLPEQMHKALIQGAYDETVVGHLSREGAAIEARETPLRKQKSVKKKKKTKRGRPRKGEERPAEPTRLALQVALYSVNYSL
ncbi:MAG: hypothetical protein OXC62_11280, partial [Aestuariivita sp.]|nr:hypothetical protein [Aestuariivita sp.]